MVKGPKSSLSTALPGDPDSGTSTLNTSGLKTQADIDAAIALARAQSERIRNQRSGGGATGLTTSAGPPGLSGVLPPAQQDTGTPAGDNTPLGQVTKAPGVANTPTAKQPAAPAQPSGAYNTIDTNSPLGKAAQIAAKKFQDGVKTAADAGDPRAKAAYDDMNAGMKGGAFTVIMKPDGGVYVQGAKPGTGYFLGNPQGAKQ